MPNEEEPAIIVYTGEKPHACQTARHIDDLAVQVDKLENSIDRFRIETRKEMARIHVKNAVLTVGIALILYGLYEKGVLASILGVC